MLIEDSDRGSRILYFLHAGDQRIALRFPSDPPELATGTRVPVHGRWDNDGALVVTLELPVRYRRVGETAWLAGTTENISRSGVLFHADRPFDVDTPVEISIAMPPVAPASTSAEVRCQAHIVRIATSLSKEEAQTLMAAAFSDFKFSPAFRPFTSH